MSINFILGGAGQIDNTLQQLSDQPAWQPFDPRAKKFVEQFSKRILTHKEIRQYPELAALGHWFRGANLKKYAERFAASEQNSVSMGRGVAFHLAPSNVDSIFMYSWLISLLAGNCNIVRVSQKPSDQLLFLVSILRDLLESEAGESIQPRLVLITYPHNADITAQISAISMLRVVWGGDSTVNEIRKIPSRADTVEVGFPDRFSLAALNATEVLSLDTTSLKTLASNFYNDAFWFAQQACSSPKLISWVGSDADIAAAKITFWKAVDAEIKARDPENSAAMNMARVSTAFEYAADRTAAPASGRMTKSEYPLRLELETDITPSARAMHCGNGLFLERSYANLNALAKTLSRKEQTLSVFGFARDELLGFIHFLPPRSIDRITEVGSALDFSNVWDGADLFTTFSRKITLPNVSA